MVGPSSIPNPKRALDHYAAMCAELERRQRVETAERLLDVAELNQTIQREQSADALIRRKHQALRFS